MTIKQALAWATQKLQVKKIKSASLDAEVLLSFILKKSKEFLYTYPEKNLSARQAKKLESLIKRRAKGEPVAYLIGHKEFYGLDFYVDNRVLIPRPETELLIEEILNYLTKPRRSPRAKTATNYKLKIADIGTGSGCIAVSLKKHLPHSKIYATDISKSALAVAEKNARKHKAKITFLHGDLLQPLKNRKQTGQIDVIIANLPYLDDGYKNLLNSSEKISLRYEPSGALYGGRYGLKIYKKLFRQIKQWPRKPKVVFCEIGHSYKNQLEKLIKKHFPSCRFQIKKDLSGFNRILIIKM